MSAQLRWTDFSQILRERTSLSLGNGLCLCQCRTQCYHGLFSGQNLSAPRQKYFRDVGGWQNGFLFSTKHSFVHQNGITYSIGIPENFHVTTEDIWETKWCAGAQIVFCSLCMCYNRLNKVVSRRSRREGEINCTCVLGLTWQTELTRNAGLLHTSDFSSWYADLSVFVSGNFRQFPTILISLILSYEVNPVYSEEELTAP